MSHIISFIVISIILPKIFSVAYKLPEHSTESQKNQFPYYVRLETHSNGYDGIDVKTCGGTLISDQWILTSSHCISHAYRLLAHFNSFTNQSINYQIRTIQQTNFISHPHYSTIHFYADIALLKLSNPIQISDTIRPIEMAKCHQPSVNDYVLAISGQNKLKSSMLRTIPFNDCRLKFPIFQRDDPILCANATFEEQCICKSNNGGPLIDASTKQLLGIINFCQHRICESNLPRTFTLIKRFYKWITAETGMELPNC